MALRNFCLSAILVGAFLSVVGGAPMLPLPMPPMPMMFPTVHIVGDDKGWTLDFDYAAWASKRVFKVGDILVFKYPKDKHNVFKVDGPAFKACTVPNGAEPLTSGHDVVELKAPGKKWYICGVAKHCAEHNQKLVINVEGGSPAPSPMPPMPMPMIFPTVHIVGGDRGWTLDFDYAAWASKRIFKVGDVLVFNYTKEKHNVYKVDGPAFKSCDVPATGVLNSGHDVIELKTPGKTWYICGVAKHCAEHNMKLVINVEGGGAPSPSPTPPSSSAHGGIFMSKYFVIPAVVLATIFSH